MSGAVGDLGGIGDRRVRVAAVADADSFVKWAGALLDTLPDPDARLALVRTPLLASLEQERTALAGTTIGPERVSRVDYGQLAEWIGDRSPDVVVVAGRGPFVRLVMRQIDRVHPRPVVVMGFPGISIPAQRGALLYRREADLLLVHSRRELRAFTELGERLDVPVRLAVARLPYAVPPGETARRGTDLVFAAQAIIPRQHAERVQIADILRRAALADPTRRVVVKLRSRPELGESETHFERAGYPELIGEAPPNLVFSHAPMSAALAEAEGLVTVSSTAAIEAMAMGVPVIALDTFGVTKTNLNTVFTGSGVLGGADDVIARRFRHPDPAWMPDNYFHDERDVTWQAELEELVARRREGQLAAHVVPAPRGGPLHLAWHRKSVLGAEDRTVSGAVALALGSPVVRAILATRRWRGRRGDHTWSDDTSDITVTPARYQDPIRRPARGARVAG